jgi:hypothetical protein
MRNVEIPESCSVRDKAGDEPWNQLLVNLFAHAGRHTYRVAEPPPRHKGVVWLPLDGRPGSGRTTPKQNGVAEPPHKG